MDGDGVALTPKEFDLLVTLIENRGLVLTREQLLERVWGFTFLGDSRTIDVHVRQLRRKLGDACPIQTVWHRLQGPRQAVTLAAPWRTLRGRLVLAAVAGLVTAAVVFAAVGAGLIRSQSQAVARGELDRQARALARIVRPGRARRPAGRRVPVRLPPTPSRRSSAPRRRSTTPGWSHARRRAADGRPPRSAEELDYEVLEEAGVQRIFRLPDDDRAYEASAAPVFQGGIPVGAVLLGRPPGRLAPPGRTSRAG